MIPACPDWCKFRENHPGFDHDYDSVMCDDPHTHTRFHTSAYGPGQEMVPYIAQEELNRGGVVTFGPLHVDLNGEELTPDRAYQLANQLREAAVLAQRINRAAAK